MERDKQDINPKRVLGGNKLGWEKGMQDEVAVESMLLVLGTMDLHLLHQRLNLVNKKSQPLEPLLSIDCWNCEKGSSIDHDG